MPAWAAAGTLPDIIYVHGSRATPWAHEGIIIDIHDIVTADEEFMSTACGRIGASVPR